MPIIENLHPVHDAQAFFDLWVRLCPPYRQAQFVGKANAEIPYRTMAAQMARVMQRVSELHDACFTALATGGTYAQVDVTVTWTLGTTLLHGMQKGGLFAQTPWGVRYVLSEGYEVAGSQAPGYQETLSLTAEWMGNDWNVDARDVSLFAVPADGSCDPYGGALWTPSTTDAGKQEFLDGVADGSIAVVGDTAATGGTLPTLDLLASEKGMPRVGDESDELLRRRLMRLPLTITRDNILQAVDEHLAPYGVTATMVEWWENPLIVGKWVVGKSGPRGSRSFIIIVPNLESLLVEQGIIVGKWVVGKGWVGEDTSALDGLLNSLQAIVDKAKAGGVCGRVLMAE